MEARARDLEMATRLLSSGFELLARHQTLNDATVHALKLAADAFSSGANATGSTEAPDKESTAKPSIPTAQAPKKKKRPAKERRERMGPAARAAADVRELAWLQAKMEHLGQKKAAPTSPVREPLQPLFTDPPPSPPLAVVRVSEEEVLSQLSAEALPPAQHTGKRAAATLTPPSTKPSPQSLPSTSKRVAPNIMRLAEAAFSNAMQLDNVDRDSTFSHSMGETREFVTSYANSRPNFRSLLGDEEKKGIADDIVNLLAMELAPLDGNVWVHHLESRCDMVIAEVSSKNWRRSQLGR